MSDHPIDGLMRTAMDSIQEMTGVNTIIGDPIETPDGSVILTVSKVGFGFAAGGSEFQAQGQGQGQSDSDSDSDANSQQNKLPFGGGSGGGVSITPIAFLVVGPAGIKTIHLDNNTHLYEKLMDLAPQAVDKINKIIKGQQKDQAQGGQGQGQKGNGRGGQGVKRRGQNGGDQQDFDPDYEF